MVSRGGFSQVTDGQRKGLPSSPSPRWEEVQVKGKESVRDIATAGFLQ